MYKWKHVRTKLGFIPPAHVRVRSGVQRPALQKTKNSGNNAKTRV